MLFNQMIKIDFKEALPIDSRVIAIFDFGEDNLFNDPSYKSFWKYSEDLRAVLPYISTQDPMLDRSHILTQLGITEQQDKLFQEQYKNV